MDLEISIIVPVYNRPDEIRELLQSLSEQVDKRFEIIIVEDGSQTKCESIINEFSEHLSIKYFYKENSGPGQSRNYGFEKSKGNYAIFLDSDCVIPKGYFKEVWTQLNDNYVDAFGGPDAAHADFTNLQKAINYSMTSFFTTGGIRGGGEKLDKFYPRSFNMGYSKQVFEKTGGFSKMRFGEDIDMSIRILNNGFKTRLFKDAFVYHKRRTNLKQFYKQIYNSGIARINLYKLYPESLKLVHFAPAVFLLGIMFLILSSVLLAPCILLFIVAHIIALFLDSSIRNKSLIIGFLSVITSYIQLLSYGLGFIIAVWKRIVLNKDAFSAFNNSFYD